MSSLSNQSQEGIGIKVENGTDIILVLLYSDGSSQPENEPIVGNTRLVKLIFLLEQETSLRNYLKDFKYDAYNFGPYSSELFDSLQALINAGLVESKETKLEGNLNEADRFQIELQMAEEGGSPKTTISYSLTSNGERVASLLFNSLEKSEQEELSSIKKTFNSMNLRKLLQYIYRKYPKFTTESVIKDYVY